MPKKPLSIAQNSSATVSTKKFRPGTIHDSIQSTRPFRMQRRSITQKQVEMTLISHDEVESRTCAGCARARDDCSGTQDNCSSARGDCSSTEGFRSGIKGFALAREASASVQKTLALARGGGSGTQGHCARPGSHRARALAEWPGPQEVCAGAKTGAIGAGSGRVPRTANSLRL
uniref:Uncharacterized protein n=1 Tax=Candidatus Kentrum eta TaxID=2126337 RepID=A0A450UGD7_9GAMM|nr:MAG: hypothetical protein BECKH772A_GA0070896_100337 [Candidatus Kentron sp. H]VFJ92675.1 MAG: hypothetical protein BECKH772B_GA0070898_100327 [Candidatus Kentron sp. H]VFJ99472.1 MAG: hypothetical protein BECKH772C_GA0070978_100327 [Candidatus Kentron sp. H]